ncbi:MAG: hypothetical protein AYK18_06415 [Theionarchaea archaeon DG-70]|nr:MAG: hypothetical protein AYK18_06415 [Theionarchaea archaeon DG-70]
MPELSKEDINIKGIAGKALQDEKVLSELLEGILSKADAIRYTSFQVLLLLSETHPDILYPHWDYIADLLGSTNNYTKYIAVYLIANLTKIDTENKFDEIFDTYYSILEGKKTMTAAHVAAVSGKIARYKPVFKEKITEKLLSIDTIHKGSQKELIKGYAIHALDEYIEDVENREPILKFVQEQLQSKSPKTRKTAEKFLEKWGNFSSGEV